MADIEFRYFDGVLHKKVYSAYITVNGKRVYPKTARCFAFWVPVE